MKILTLSQPWAPALVRGYLDVINQPWPTDYRGPLLIHAGRFDRRFPLRPPPGTTGPSFLAVSRARCDLDAVLGVVELVGVADAEDCQLPFAGGPPGWCCWLTRNPLVFDEPVMIRGGSFVPGRESPASIPQRLEAKLRAAAETAMPYLEWLDRHPAKVAPEDVYEPRRPEPEGGVWRGD